MSRRYVVLAAAGGVVVMLLLVLGWFGATRMLSARGAIHKAQYDAVGVGETRPEVLAELGAPLRDAGYIGDYGAKPVGSTCDYYNEDDFLSPVAYRFCYRNDRLVAKAVSRS